MYFRFGCPKLLANSTSSPPPPIQQANEKLEVACVYSPAISELMRSIRAHIDSLLCEHKAELSAMNLTVAHSLAVSLSYDLDKEFNNHVEMSWVGWHFPEVDKLVQDHQAFAKVVKAIGMKQNAANVDLSEILQKQLETKGDCPTPNLTCFGELVGARLISHAGSLVSLAKAASTIQILGDERALFRALKTKKNTPKYGLIYHAQLITQAPAKLKGKDMSIHWFLGGTVCEVGADNFGTPYIENIVIAPTG
ncbi:unnamed protein product [Cylicocyclus nassatus]|uniref:Nop domain-containing protein n=1 Tax=Cylicocyclus nassatus TaxID=53992 RepID=A0AA36H923_CYLNA|nr:unnamed protein product [Cylicocyclus nassatus]